MCRNLWNTSVKFNNEDEYYLGLLYNFICYSYDGEHGYVYSKDLIVYKCGCFSFCDIELAMIQDIFNIHNTNIL